MPHDDFWNAASALAAFVYCLITAVTLVLLMIQVREARRGTLAQFINQLGKEFSEFSWGLATHKEDVAPEELTRRFKAACAAC
jgi:hypothetical protein